jgi:signal transduction histidine kinase
MHSTPMRSLRLRIIGAIALVCALTLAVVALYVGRATILVHMGAPPAAAVAALRATIASSMQRTHSPQHAELALIAAKYSVRILLVNPTTRVAVSSWEPDSAQVVSVRPDGTFEVTQRAPGSSRSSVILLRDGVPVPGDKGRSFWRLFIFEADPANDALAPVRESILRSVWQSAALGLAAAVMVAFLLGSYIVKPIRELTVAANAMSDGDTSRRVMVRIDDEIGHLSASFNTMAASIERTERLRRQMVTDVAHELRSPLTRMIVQLEAATDGHISQAEALASAHDEASRLAAIVNDLRDLSLADAHDLSIPRHEMSLAYCIEQALDRAKQNAAQAKVTLVHDIASDLPMAMGDEMRVAQIMDNLISNALRHTPAGGHVVVGANATPLHVECFVQDDGPGIEADQLQLIFERFYRVDPSRSRATGGSGLGLAIVKSLVEALGGHIGVESLLGHGARFTWTLVRSDSNLG